MTDAADDRYEVVIIKYGTRETVRSEVYLNYGLYHEPDGPIGMDYFVWVIRNRARTILVDTGFSPTGGARRSRTTLVTPPDAWSALGIHPESSPLIVLTHAHYDHTGNLAHFPNSQIVMAEAELDFWAGPQAHRVLFHHSVEDEDLELLRRARAAGRVITFEDDYAPAPGVRVLRIGGHTPGQSVVVVQTHDGPVLLASDAVHYFEELDRAMPFMSVADLVAMYAGFDRIADMLADGSVVAMVPGHDPQTLSRFTPLSDALLGLAATVGTTGVSA
ncbi:N-acyl homoserine lactonase family protein [Leifsonia sp. H3M29-4]|uniref:N-acyl homoserine lactonase family protein n=1 Tax=Salinibacterium metalliresistens TaxID=3031321 RepID=UPI0023D97F78|nr:N-acyl homoserine lactonase family protein [Salinibacterium metalliresistens]MDF1480006.1 N-acyl homoserine lactonase family protein [Salinibacterium metalliresistens]